MSNGSVGVISLDLLIKDKLGEQLEKIKSSVRSPAEKIGEQINNSVSKSMNNVKKTLEKMSSVDPFSLQAQKAELITEKISILTNKINSMEEELQQCDKAFEFEENIKTIESLTKRYDRLSANINNARLQQVNLEKQLAGMSGIDLKGTQGRIFEEKIIDGFQEKISETSEMIKEKLGNFDVSSDPVDRLRQEIDLTNTQMSLLQKKWQELSAAEPSDKVTAQLAATEQRIISTRNKLDKLRSGLAEYENTGRSAGEKIASAFNHISSVAGKTGSKIKSLLGGAFRKVKDVGSKALGTIGKAAGSIGARFKALGKSAAGIMKPVTKLGSALKRAFKSVFLIAGVYAAFRAIKNGLLEAANADEEFSKSLNAVKANLSIAFTPILQAIMPALNTLMSGLASVTRSVAGFIAGLFGTTYKQAAEATKKLKGVTDAAKKAKLSTAGIDEMNILSDDSSSDSENQGIDYSNIDMSEPELPDWAQRLKDSIRSGDWAGVGGILAERVNSVLSSVNWDKIQSKVNSGIAKITDGINGFLNNINWETLGDTLAGGLNTITGAINTFYSKVKWDKLGSGIAKGLNQAIKKTNWKQLGKAFSANIQAVIDAAYAFVTTFDWSGFGNAFGTAVNGWFEGIDFGKAGRTLSEGIKGLLDFAIKAVQTIDWRQIGLKIAEFIGNIDFSGIARKFFELLGSALGAAVSLLWGAIQNAVFAIRDYFSEKIKDCGGNIIEGLFKGIGDALRSVGKWIKDNIFKPFIEGFKKAFDIHSPSKEMAVMGGYIIDGLFNAISEGIAKIKEIFDKMLETIKGVFEKIDSWFSEKFSAAREAVKEVFSGIGGWFSDRWDDIKNVFSSVGSWFGEQFSGAWTKIKEAFSDVEKFFGDMWDSIKGTFTDLGEKIGDSIGGAFKTVINGVLSTIEDVINGGIKMINGATEFINEIPGVNIGKIDTLELPRLATGGLATAPTLAMVGDNKNAAVDPEVIAPLSKLQGMLGGDNSEIVELLKIIVELLKGGMNIEIINYLFRGSSEFSREILRVIADEKARSGG